jgi:hypothetical protein
MRMYFSSPFVDLMQAVFVSIGAGLIAFGYKTVKEMGNFSTLRIDTLNRQALANQS